MFISSFFLIISGHQFVKFIKINNNFSVTENGLFGFILLGLVSLTINFILPLTAKINTIIFFILILSFFIQNRHQIDKIKKIFIISFYVTFLSLIFISFSDSYRPDSFLYHFPYTNLINENKILSGISLVHFRFGHISMMQYIDAIFYNFINGKEGVTLPISIIFSLFFIFLIEEINKILKEDNYLKFYNFFIILSFIFLCVRMSRYSDYGNDHPATIFFLYFMAIYIKNFNSYILDIKKYLSLLATFIFTLKVFYFVPILLCMFIWLKKINFKVINLGNTTCLLILFFWFLKNILISGCLIYPASFTCNNNLPWYNENNPSFINAEQISKASEAWAKNWNTYRKIESGGTTTIDKYSSQKKYIKNFNWVGEWSKVHGKYIANKLLPLLIVLLIFYFLTKKNISFPQKLNKKNKKIFIFFFLINLFGLILWFLKFPIMRYGLAYIFMQIFFISYFFFRGRFVYKAKYTLLICMFIFFTKNTLRIIDDSNVNLYPKMYQNVKYAETIKENFTIYTTKKSSDLCGYFKSPCTNYNENLKKISVKEKNGYLYFYLIN